MNFWKGNMCGVMSSRLMGRLWSFKLRSLVVGTVNGSSTSFFSTKHNQKESTKKTYTQTSSCCCFNFNENQKKHCEEAEYLKFPKKPLGVWMLQTEGIDIFLPFFHKLTSSLGRMSKVVYMIWPWERHIMPETWRCWGVGSSASFWWHQGWDMYIKYIYI